MIRTGVTDYLHKSSPDQYTTLVRRVEHAVDSDGQFCPEVATELDAAGSWARTSGSTASTPATPNCTTTTPTR
jgi:hypothetical protein